MHLVSVTLQGFKSFPERTEIAFHPGVTAIVGPNGSGKSNVTDAIRWVLGEQSAKTLRGGKMEDVIFSGTELRRPMSFGEVVLKLDNSDYQLPIDAAEVEVTRRLYRSGESLYQINRKDCRLKDIVELFLDTGIGREGYSIVGQGRIDDVLSNKSEDRRRIFDEAAGISRYKARRDEAERKLTATELEAQRATDVLNEMERQLKPLQKQAESAKVYLELSEEFKRLDLALIFRDMTQIEAELREFQTQNESFDSDLETNQAQEQELEKEESTLRTQVEVLEQRDEALLTAREEARERLQSDKNRIQLLNARLEQVTEQAQTRTLRIENAQKRIRELEAQLKDHNDAIYAQRSDAEHLTKELSELEQDLTTQTSEREAKRTRERDIQERLRNGREALLDRRHQLALLEQEAGQSERVEAQLEREKEVLSASVEEAESKYQSTIDVLNELRVKGEKTQTAIRELETQIGITRDELFKLEEQMRSMEAKEQQRVYRLNTLEGLRERLEGYHESVKRLLAEVRGSDLGETIHGPLGDLIQVEAGYETAIETALGGAIQNVVVDDARAAGRLIDVLKQKRLGRVTFLPLRDLATGGLSDAQIRLAKGTQGFVGVASSLVRYAPEVEPAVLNTLARTVVMKDLDSGNRLSRESQFRIRIVTLEGELIMPGGAITGGSQRQQQGLLARPREIEALIREGEGYEERLATARQKVQRLRIQLAESEASKQDLSELIQEDAKEYAKRETEQSQLEQARDSAKAQLARLVVESSGLQQQRVAAQKNRLEMTHELDQLEQTVFKAEQEAIEVDAAIGTISDAIQRLRDQVSEVRTRQAAKKAELETAEQLSRHYEREMQQHQDVLDTVQNEHDSGSNMALRIEAELAQLDETIREKEAALQATMDEREITQAERRKVTAQLEETRATRQRLTEMKQSLEVQRARLLVRQDALTDRLNQTRNRLWEEYEMTFANQAEWFVADLKEGPSKKRLNELRDQIRALGSVNINAVDEYQTISERYTFMQTQLDDIEESRKSLERLIRQITSSMRTAFEESFTFIKQEFKLVFAQLFNGGEADIILEDETDILSSGIEIKASPPGKKLQNMLLLSGGERCLCAIALIFALQRLRPAPFCVLDEVEAALDDANIFRFNDYVRERANDIQFILVTHRKGTMEAADRLYGVTMQERGISRMLSLQLS